MSVACALVTQLRSLDGYLQDRHDETALPLDRYLTVPKCFCDYVAQRWEGGRCRRRKRMEAHDSSHAIARVKLGAEPSQRLYQSFASTLSQLPLYVSQRSDELESGTRVADSELRARRAFVCMPHDIDRA
jgi:hypothetical protein